VEQKHLIEVAFSDKSLDALGEATKHDINDDLGIASVEAINTTELYYFETSLVEEKIREITEKVFIDPLIQKYSLDKDIYTDYNYCIEVKFNADVTDNVGMVAEEAIKDFTGKKEGNIRTAKRFYLHGALTKEETERIASELLANDVIEKYSIKEGKK